MALGLLRANVDKLAHGKIWCVHPQQRHPRPFGNITQLLLVTSISDILWPYRRSLEQHIELLDTLRTHDVSFETSRKVANTWVEQPHLEDDGWDVRWEPLCEVEVDRWDSR